MSVRTLYVCYFWLNESLVQTQVLPYLREIAKGGAKVSLLTFERDTLSKEKVDGLKKQLADEGIEWNFLKYHKSPSVPATIFDILNGAFFIRKKLQRENIDVLHTRVHVPTLMGALARKLSFGKKPKLLFDIRGFFPEEYTDAGVWKKNGWIYKTVKRVEKWLLKESDAFVVLTEKARQILFPESKATGFDKLGRPVEVIPCCVDINRFKDASQESREEIRKKLNITDRNVIAYVGSFGGWYLTDEMIDFFATAIKQDAQTFALILTQRDKEKVVTKLKENGFSEQDYFVDSVSHVEIPRYLNASDVAISFIKPCYSKQASSPTKNAEYLASGLPIIVNSGVGDTDEIVAKNKIGVIVQDLNSTGYQKALAELEELSENVNNLGEICREKAKSEFDLQTVGGARYRSLYQKTLAKE